MSRGRLRSLDFDGGRRKMGLVDDGCRKNGEEGMAEPIPSLGELEVQVLRLVWREQPCPERRVTELVQADRPVARTTVLKTIQRLEEKGLLVREKGTGR